MELFTTGPGIKPTISDEQLRHIALALTIKRKPHNRGLWVGRGLIKHGDPRADLAKYWRKKVDSNPEAMKLALETWEEFSVHHRKKIVAEAKRKAVQEAQAAITDCDTNKTEEANAITPPSLATKAKSLASSAVGFAKNGFKMTTKEQLQARLDICHACPFWDKLAFGGTGKCTICGCSTQAKLRMASEKCPKDYWGPIVDSPVDNPPNVS